MKIYNDKKDSMKKIAFKYIDATIGTKLSIFG